VLRRFERRTRYPFEELAMYTLNHNLFMFTVFELLFLRDVRGS
jgi:hypothetical protein